MQAITGKYVPFAEQPAQRADTRLQQNVMIASTGERVARAVIQNQRLTTHSPPKVIAIITGKNVLAVIQNQRQATHSLPKVITITAGKNVLAVI